MAAAPTRHPVYYVMHKPKTFGFVERRLFVVALTPGFIAWNLTSVFLAGVAIALPLYVTALWVTYADPQLVDIYVTVFRSAHRQGLAVRSEFDPLKRTWRRMVRR